MVKSLFSLLLVTVMAGGSIDLQAHDIAVFPTAAADGVRLRIRFGHPGDYQAAAASKLITLDAVSPGGERRALAGRVRPDGQTLITSPVTDLTTSGTWLFATFYDNGFLLRTADGRSVNTTRAEYPSADSVTHNLKYGKALLAVGASGPGFDRRLDHPLELVPRQDPFAVPIGQSLELLLLYQGRPLAGEAVFLYPEREADATVQVKSDADGVVRVPIDRAGRYLISAEHEVPSRHPDLATRDNFAASLVFTRR